MRLKFLHEEGDPLLNGGLDIAIARGEHAIARLGDSDFAAAWRSLCEACPWSTGNQTFEYAYAWYSVYCKKWEPVLVLGTDNRTGRIIGVLPLALTDLKLSVCGANDAEYQAWISLPEIADQFISEALRRLWRMFPRGRITFRHLPQGTPLGWVRRSQRVLIEKRITSRMNLSDRGIDNFYEALRNKNGTDHLREWGTFKLLELRAEQDLAMHIDAIATLYDFRQGALKGVRPFCEDNLKREFYLALAKQSGVLHATVLCVGTKIVAAHLGICNRESVSLGILANSPFYPGELLKKVHILRLIQLLLQQGFRHLDLTADRNQHDDKDLADETEEVNIADVFASGLKYRRLQWQRAIWQVLHSNSRLHAMMRIAKTLTSRLWHRFARSRQEGIIRSLIRSLKIRLYSTRELRFYSQPVEMIDKQIQGSPLSLNCLEHLLLYQPAKASDRPVSVFLSDCQQRCGQGDWVYTAEMDEQLIHYAWMGKRIGRDRTDLGDYIIFPPESVTLWDDYTHPLARGRGLHKLSLHQRLHDAGRLAHARTAFISVFGDNLPSRKNIERAGFAYHSSLYRKIILGHRRLYWVRKS